MFAVSVFFLFISFFYVLAYRVEADVPMSLIVNGEVREGRYACQGGGPNWCGDILTIDVSGASYFHLAYVENPHRGHQGPFLDETN